MVWFSKKRKWLEVEEREVSAAEAPKESTTPDEPASEAAEPQNWIWVEGVKCVKKDMTPFYGNMQYEVGVMYEMPKEEVKCCQSGYHFCRTLQDLWNYSTFRVCNGNRYFKVKALVNEQEYNRYGEFEKIPGSYIGSTRRIDKFAAAAIVFTEELTIKEILDAFYSISKNRPLPEKYEHLIIEQSYSDAIVQMELDNLLEDGYSEIFAKQIVAEDRYHLAHAIASQEGVSMDMRVWYIYTNKKL
jgi:hypothetical protein